jgi:hypothetical protein
MTCASAGAEPTVIDIVDALDLLDGCVRDRGADYRAPRRRDSADEILNVALINAGSPGANGLNLTLGADVAFRAAASAERLGKPWGPCVQAALRAASTFVELIPDGVLGCTAEIPIGR